MTIETGDPADVYAPPCPVTDASECHFYHTMDIPGHGLVVGEWDLRNGVEEYLGHVDFAGKRVLEVGTADGYLTFAIESRGGNVVSHDVSDQDRLDTVPFARRRAGWSTATGEFDDGDMISRLNNAYWFCHQAYGSKARLVHSDIYALPETIGAVDISVFGSILLHTRDPFLALSGAADLTEETIVVTEGLGLVHLPAPLRWARRGLPRRLRRPLMRFMPDGRNPSGPHGWWRLTPDIVQAFLSVLGFERSGVTTHRQLYQGHRRRLFTVVAHRTVAR